MTRGRLLVVSPYPPPADGIGSHTRMLMPALREQADVAIAAPGSGEPESDASAGVHRVLAPHQRRARVALLQRFRPDALYVQFAISAYGGALSGLDHLLRLARRERIRVVTVFHEPERELAALPGLGRAIYRRVAAATDAPVIHAEPARDALAALGVGSATAIPHGVPLLPSPSVADVERARLRYGLRGRVVLALGFIHPDKGADVLCAAAPALLDALPDATIAIAGEPRERRAAFRAFGRADARHLAQLRAAAAFAGERIRFPGFIADDDLPAVLAAASAMALPYRRITQSGIAHLCVSAAVPAVASSIRGLVATLGDGAAYVPPGDPDALAAALIEVLEDPEVRADQREELLERRAAWAPAAVAERIGELALGGRGGATVSRLAVR